MKRKKATTTI